MKKYISLVLFWGLVLSFSPASAQEVIGPGELSPVINPDLKPKLLKEEKEAYLEKMKSEREAYLEKMKSEREAFMQELKTKKENLKQANATEKDQFCEKAKRSWGERFGMSINALERIQGKVEDTIKKYKAKGKDTTEAEKYLKLSKEKSEAAKKKLKDTKAALPTDCSKLTPEDYEKIKIGTREARDLLKESREYLHMSIKTLKEFRESSGKTEKTND